MTPHHRRFSRGLALIATLMLLVVFTILTGSLLDAMIKESSLTGVHGQSNRALQAAYAGIEDMQYQLEENDSGIAPGFVPTELSLTYANDDGSTSTFEVSVDPQRWQASLPYFLVHSIGTSGGVTRSVDALIRKHPYSAYQLFTNSEQSNVGGKVYYATGEQFNGPVYSGGPMNIFYDKSGNSAPIFLGPVTTAKSPNYVPGGPPNMGAIFGSTFKQVSAPLTLPTAKDNSAVENAALSGQANPPSAPVPPGEPGLYLNGAPPKVPGGPLNSGLYIAGNVDIRSTGIQPTTGCAACGTETLNLNIAGAGQVNVSIDYGANTTTVTNAAGTVIGSYSGVPSGEPPPGDAGPNGAVFVNGQATFEDGSTVHGKMTFAQPDGLGESNPPMFLKGSLTYADSSIDELALWANDIILEDSNSTPDLKIEVDGMLLTGYFKECTVECKDGTFYNKFCTGQQLCGGGVGDLTLFGSLIENVRGKRGTLGPKTGFETFTKFDGRLSKSPPPYTPTTVQYDVVALCAEDGSGNCGQ